ncbi:MAG: GNAT family N-acetyltransferase [Anaerolineae bacterium]|nr:GNAT family N-acetyltransferase [Anaerolineae bacterium]
MTSIRRFRPLDAEAVGVLIADTFGACNLGFAPPQARGAFLGPFRHARSSDPAHRERIAEMIAAEMVFVAEERGQIVGVLRGRPDKLQSLFVRVDRQRRGIGRRLVEHYEATCRKAGSQVIRLQATLEAVPFYLALGYKRSTGVRTCTIFDGEGFPYQPMKKTWTTASDLSNPAPSGV